jgi:hypothetical protein
MDWIHQAQDRDRWRALMNTVMNQIPKNAGSLLTNRVTAAFKDPIELEIHVT